MRKIEKIISIGVLGILMIFMGTISKNEVLETSSIPENKKIGWGIKRKENHEQPDLGAYNRKTLEEFEGIGMGNSESKKIYLTFDEGYEAGYTESILQTLDECNITATFFLTAHYINTQEQLVAKMIEKGHIIGNHTVNHKSMPNLTLEEMQKEIMDLHIVVKEKFNYEMKYLRPPMGEYSKRSLEKTKQLGYTTVMWSFAYLDYDEKKQPSVEEAREKIIDNIHSGEIMLLHGNSKTNAEVLKDVINEIKSEGYTFCSLDEFER